jgi:hypothetical protein
VSADSCDPTHLRQFIARGQWNKADRHIERSSIFSPISFEVSQTVERVDPSATLSWSSEVLICGDEFARVMGLSAGSSRDSRAQVVAKNGYRKFFVRRVPEFGLTAVPQLQGPPSIGNDGVDGAPNGISVPRWALSSIHLKGSRPWASLSGILLASRGSVS